MVAQFVVQVLLLPLVLILGDGDKTVGFEKTMGIFAVVGIVFFIITFLTTRERIIPKPEQKSSVGTDLKDLTRNKPWIAMLVITIFVFITLSLKGGTYVYYFENYLSEEHLAAFLVNVGFIGFIDGLNSFLTGIGLVGFQWPEDAPTSAFSLFNAGGIIAGILGIVFSKKLADRFGKRDVFGAALFVASLCLLAFYFFSPSAIALVFIFQIFHGFFYGITTPLLWAMIAECGRLFGMEEQPPCHGHHFLGHDLRTEGRLEHWRCPGGRDTGLVWLRPAAARAVGRRHPRNTALGERSAYHYLYGGHRLPVLL